jgi:DNA (cytosine-5)-methyltransferase 1
MVKEKEKAIPIIDLFAGPGGLGEGFSAFRARDGKQPFRVALSIEKDPYAHSTLTLRSFLRQFEPGNAPAAYYDYLREANEPEPNRRKRLFAANSED